MNGTLIIAAGLALGLATAQAAVDLQGSASAQSSASVAAAPGGAGASGGAAASGGATPAAAAGGELAATLSKSIDAGRAKPGDAVTATAIRDLRRDGRVVVPRGSRLVGRVTQARPRGAAGADGSAASELGIVFDRALLRGGGEVPIDATLRAVASADAAADAAAGGPVDAGAAGSAVGRAVTGSRAAGGGLLGGVAGAAGGLVDTAARTGAGADGTVHAALGATTGLATRSTGALGGLDASGELAAASRGVFGLPGIELREAGSAAAGGTVLTSVRRNVRLPRGTQLLLATGQASGTAQAAATGALSGAAPAGNPAAAATIGANVAGSASVGND